MMEHMFQPQKSKILAVFDDPNYEYEVNGSTTMRGREMRQTDSLPVKFRQLGL